MKLEAFSFKVSIRCVLPFSEEPLMRNKKRKTSSKVLLQNFVRCEVFDGMESHFVR